VLLRSFYRARCDIISNALSEKAALGEISPESVVTPGIFVNRVLHVPL